MRGWVLALSLALAVPAAAQEEPPELHYDVLYDVQIVPTERAARVTIRLSNGSGYVHAMRFRIDPERHREVRGDGEVVVGEDSIEWKPGRRVAELRYVFRIDHLRDERSYDARCAETWAIFRGDDLVPPAWVKTEDYARSRSTLRLRTPQRWSVAAPFPKEGNLYRIENPERGFDRPTGWIAVGRMGIRRERIEGVSVAIAGPVGHRLRRLDMMALLRWVLPPLKDAMGELPERFLVVGAGDPMWRGGLSGPNSAFIHATRPLISGDATSTLLHELMHAVLGVRAGPGGDWIVEGMAELYSLEALVRSRTISRRRYRRALADLAQRGNEAKRLTVERAHGAVTARAVTVLHDLDQRLEKASDGERSLDDVARRLAAEGGEVTNDRLREIAEEVGGIDLGGFFGERVGKRTGR